MGKAKAEKDKAESDKKKEKEKKKKKTKSKEETEGSGEAAEGGADQTEENTENTEGFVELVPDLVWMVVNNSQNLTKSTSSETPESHLQDPILSHSQPKFPTKFLKPPSPLKNIPIEEISIVWTTVIVTTIHLMFEFQVR